MTMKQKDALTILKKGHNVFLTGEAGSGKTHVLQQFIAYLQKKDIRYAVTASTGIAATHLGGRTIHSWSGMGIHQNLREKDITQHILGNFLIKERLQKTRVVIIDEISMLHAYQLDLLNKILRLAHTSWEPFGGVQIVLSGDFFQLPPIIPKDTTYKKHFAFDAQSWKEANITVCYLSEQFRHSDKSTQSVLNAIRTNTVTQDTIDTLNNSGTAFDSQDDVTRLFTHNADVDAMNARELAKIDGEEHVYTMTAVGNEKIAAVLRKNCLAPECLVLKEGALVMFVRNNFEEGYVNGSCGTVVDFSDDGLPVVETTDGDTIVVHREEWSVEESDDACAAIRQLPLRLAWAITVHKSQGMTLDAAEIDLRKCFEYGMGYVALSRVRSLDCVRLLGCNAKALHVHPTILKKDAVFRKQSAQNNTKK
ncbi:MAG: helicase [Candidatus Moraniibacteriota bacterium]|nr:MAG: helicase [Candidatus Moranbacteria bacterium]